MSTPSDVGGAGEHALVDLIRRRIPPAPPWVVVGVGDDAPVVEPARNALDVYTTDALVDGVHFARAFTPPSAIGHRALAVNLSDLAAMGAAPRAALLSLALPPDFPYADVEALLDGLLALAGRHHVSLVGGNVTRTPGPLMVDVTAIGSVHRRRVLTRAGARPGDEVWVSGAVGAAAAGLAALAAGPGKDPPPGFEACTAAYLRPEPRVRLGTLLGRNRAATACIDLSDGLADGLHQLAAASSAGLVIDAAALPIPPAARDWFSRFPPDAIGAAICGGDDYELLFTVDPRRRSRFGAVRRLCRDLPLTKIGRVTAEPGVRLARGGADEPVPAGYEHFR